MGWPFFLFLAIALIALALHLRLALYRHDQRARRARNSAFGEPLMSVGYGADLKSSLYTPEGRRLIPWVIAADIVGVAALLFWLYWAATR